MSESVVAGGVKQLLTMLGGEWYSTEVGFVGEWVEDAEGRRRAVGRRGGTRTTPGWPDLAALMPAPVSYLLTVELKGTRTPVARDQWLYALRAMRNGQPHLIVRSGEALLWGLWFLGLLPGRLVDRPPLPGWRDERPVNLHYLARTRFIFWSGRAFRPELPPLEAAEGWPARLPRPPHPEPVARAGDEGPPPW